MKSLRGESGSDRGAIKETVGEQLAAGLRQLAEEVNAEWRTQLSNVSLLNEDATVSMDAFQTKKGGPYRKTPDARGPTDQKKNTIADDKAFVHNLEAEWSQANEPGTQRYYRDTFGVTTSDGIITQYKKRRLESHGGQLETALTIVLHKIVGKEFLAARCALYDDYASGVDQLLVDKKTGAVVGLSDEINDRTDSSLYTEKLAAIQQTARKGGVRVKYGVTISAEGEKSKIVRRELPRLPVFYLGFSSGELYELFRGMNINPQGPISPVERKFFAKIVSALESQRRLLREDPTIHLEVRRRLEDFSESLERLRGLSAALPD